MIKLFLKARWRANKKSICRLYCWRTTIPFLRNKNHPSYHFSSRQSKSARATGKPLLEGDTFVYMQIKRALRASWLSVCRSLQPTNRSEVNLGIWLPGTLRVQNFWFNSNYFLLICLQVLLPLICLQILLPPRLFTDITPSSVLSLRTQEILLVFTL